MRAELAKREGVKEQRFGLARRAIDIRAQAVARVAGTLQEIVAFGEPQVDQLSIVALSGVSQPLERRPRLRVPLASEEPLGTSQFQLVANAAGRDRLAVVEPIDLGPGHRRQIAERELVVHARERCLGLFQIAGGFRGSADAHQHIVWRRRLDRREPFVDGEGGPLITEDLIALRFAQRRGFHQKPGRLARQQGLEREARLVGMSEPKFGQSLVILRVMGEQSLPDGRLREYRQRLPVLAVDLELDRRHKRVERRSPGAATLVRHHPQL